MQLKFGVALLVLGCVGGISANLFQDQAAVQACGHAVRYQGYDWCILRYNNEMPSLQLSGPGHHLGELPFRLQDNEVAFLYVRVHQGKQVFVSWTGLSAPENQLSNLQSQQSAVKPYIAHNWDQSLNLFYTPPTAIETRISQLTAGRRK